MLSLSHGGCQDRCGGVGCGACHADDIVRATTIRPPTDEADSPVNDTPEPPENMDETRPASGPARPGRCVSIEDEMRIGLPRLRDERDRQPRDPRSARRPETRAPAHSLRDARSRQHLRQALPQVLAARWPTPWASTTRTAIPRSTTRWCGWRRTSRCRCRCWTARATSARWTATRPAAFRYTEVRMAKAANCAAGRHRQGNGRFPGQLRRQGPGADGPARPSSRTCWSTAPAASPSAWPPTSRRTTWARSSTARWR